MADYDSDSSGADDIETNVLLGYASREPTGDDFSQLGGHPVWLDGKPPSGSLAKCKVCNGYMNLVLQLHGDIPNRYPGHERRLYVWSCRRKACRRKDGSQRAFRATRSSVHTSSTAAEPRATPAPVQSSNATRTNLGQTLFGVTGSPPPTQANPFATSSPPSTPSANPFATPDQAGTNGDAAASTLPETFAAKARISNPNTTSDPTPPSPPIPWPNPSDFPDPYPPYYIDAEKEYLESLPAEIPSTTRLDPDAGEGASSAASDMKDAFESSMDKTFQRFADRLAQNPEQVLRYEFDGQPLLYSKGDVVGKTLGAAADGQQKVKTSGGGGFGRCGSCGAGRVFELQLTPHAITELEVDEMSVDGMDWGTIILAVCSQDCMEKGKKSGDVGYVEEWVGVQWEEIADKRK